MSILLLGGTSEIGGDIATRICEGEHVVLAARRPSALDAIEQRLHGAQAVHRLAFDATDLDSHRHLITQAIEVAGPITVAVLAFGILGDQQRAEVEEHHATDIATVDYTAQISLLTVLADELKKYPGHSTIVAFSSIAGWRARRANYVYGSAKAGLDAFCQGLTDALHGSNVNVVTVRPGFVIGSMTEGMSPAPLSVYPHDVADAVVKALGKKRSATLWVPSQLRILAWIMTLVPRAVWRRMPR